MSWQKPEERKPTAQEVLKKFYDDFGWQVNESSGLLNNQIYFQDMDDASTKYRSDHELKYKQVFMKGGKYFLDAGCGGEPRRSLSDNFEVHLCLDISIVGLTTAKQQLGDSGEYILADLSHLPFKDDSIDSVLASHCLYHIDKDKQQGVIKEFYRVTRKGKFILIFYSSRYNLISLFHKVVQTISGVTNIILHKLGLHLRPLPPYLVRRINIGKDFKNLAIPELYSFAYNPLKLVKNYQSADVSCLMTLSNYDTRLLRKLHLLKLGAFLFDFMETVFPHLMCYIGKFTCIKIRKM